MYGGPGSPVSDLPRSLDLGPHSTSFRLRLESFTTKCIISIMSIQIPSTRPLCCWKSVFREARQAKSMRRSLATLQSHRHERVQLPPKLPAQFWPQLPPALRPDNGMLVSFWLFVHTFGPIATYNVEAAILTHPSSTKKGQNLPSPSHAPLHNQRPNRRHNSLSTIRSRPHRCTQIPLLLHKPRRRQSR